MKRLVLHVLPLLGLFASQALCQKPLRSPEVGKVQAYSYASQPRQNLGLGTALLAEKVIRRNGSSWLQVEFGDCKLSAGSWIEILSLRDKEIEVLDAQTLAKQGGYSLYFNGDALRIRLYGGATTVAQQFTIKSLGVGNALAAPVPESLCGPDSRYRTSDKRIARMIVRRGTGYFWCTAFLISSTNCFATSGNCMGVTGITSLVVQFNVPSSTSAGVIRFPSTSDQYVWMGSGSTVAAWQNSGIGNDWGVFKTLVNSGTRRHAGAVQGAYVSFQTVPAVKTSARLSGYGMDNTPASNSGTQQSSLGLHHSTVGNRINYTVDTAVGCSGAPVEVSFTAKAYGVNTHEWCSSSGGYNSGTAGTHVAFAAARARICGGGAKPDLSPGLFWASTKTLVPNQVLSVQSIIKNRSVVTAPPSAAGYYLSKDNIITSADIYLGGFSVPTLTANQGFTDKLRTVRLPASIPNGTCYLGVLADPNNKIAESNENNNYMYYIVTCKGVSQPDLQATLFTTANTAITSGGTLRISSVTSNRGSATASSSRTGLFLSKDRTITTSDILIARLNIPSLAPNKGATITSTYRIPIAITPGTWYLGAYADYSGFIKESSETNNVAMQIVIGKEMPATKRWVEYVPRLGTMALSTTFANGSATNGGIAGLCVAAPSLSGQYYLCYWTGNSSGVPDLYTSFSLSLTNTPMFQAWFGILDTQGRAYPTFRLPIFKNLRSFMSVYTKAVFLDTRNFALLGFTQNLIPMTINR